MSDRQSIRSSGSPQRHSGFSGSAGHAPLKTGPHTATLSNELFRRLSQFIRESCGIQIPAAKKTMLEGRLRKRLRALSIDSFEEYCDYLFQSHGSELEIVRMIDVVTTNKTDFFREPDHFTHLTHSVLPDLVDRFGLGVKRNLCVWSAGCSTGEEPYTIAMVLSEFAERFPMFQFSVLATDISTAVLDTGKLGVYEQEKVDPLPPLLRQKYLLKSKDRQRGLVRMAPEIRSLVRFKRLNFMDEDYGIREPIAVVFCRNVIIYFDRSTQERILNRLCSHLIPGGYLYSGHSESLHGMDLPLVQVATNVHRKPETSEGPGGRQV